MRTLQEKYNAVLEGNFSKEQFRRDAVMQLPNVVSKFNSFEDMTAILKNRGMIAEAKKEEVTAYKKPEVDPIDLIAPDLLDDGIRAELEAKGIEGTPSEEEYTKAKEKAAKNLAKDPLHYKNAQTMPEMGEKMEKAKLQEGDTQNTFLRDRERLRDELSDKEVAAAVADEPINVGKAFRDMVMQEPEKYVRMSKDELIAAFEDFKENYYIDQEAQERMDAIAGQPDFQEGKEAKDIELSAEELEKLRKDGKFMLPDGRILHYAGTVKKENQLKEAVKALIKKVLTEDQSTEVQSLEGITKIDFDFRGDRLLGAYVYTPEGRTYAKLDQAKELLATLGLAIDPESPYMQLGRDIDAKAGGKKDPKTRESIINGIIVTTSDKTFE